jgi:hypothetical protein
MDDRSENSDSIVAVKDKAISDKLAEIRSQSAVSIESFRQRNAKIMMSRMNPDRFKAFVDDLITMGQRDPRVACFLLTMFVGKPKEMNTSSTVQMEELRALINSRMAGQAQVLDVSAEEV